MAGIDITGDGIPKLALTDEVGRQGGGCFLLFECGQRFRQIVNIDSLGNYPELKDMDGDGIPELIVSDDAFYHWPACMDGEPEPEVILRWQHGKYVPGLELMAHDPPSEQALRTAAAAIRGSPEWDTSSCLIPGALWTNAVGLMYSGHEDLAWKFLDMAWRPGFAEACGSSKPELVEYWIQRRLDASTYWPKLHRQMDTAGVAHRHQKGQAEAIRRDRMAQQK